MTITLALVDDQPLMRFGLRSLFETDDDFEVVGEAGNGADGVRLVQELRPDVVLMDVQMPELDGVKATARIRELGLPSRVLILTTFDTEEYVLDGIRAGASGYLLKDVRPGELFDVVRRVAVGEVFIQPSVASKYLHLLTTRQLETEHLSPREEDVLRRLARGLSNKLIARELDISESTVKNHVKSILAKMQVRNRTEAALNARKWVSE
ncbi:response regulator transcription factor (plasmid) [Deinococcus metallilatus]|uniref:DNA-binding NarL/FixJ family response regulator n=1 Tax=Deinococcus metallilatus TaxID=1211322 RepID=A0AAJ5F6E6_9DEIO|nr:response regulator transcription factor [Deinococcus metallilatus]MBB5295648.1 DNA-binding NarL/FixJ family response regulator [Deinococcus metallilatus]QBY06892.1 response regulator transcription factor [Deinococcus metallilatus]TLK32282.1 response regulator transcription factor [Deinococcus metallilatus]GMA14177.1 DNA-binding response regulator [Deinococcus metallilatus]